MSVHSWWEKARPHMESRPPDDGLRKLVRAVRPGARVVAVRRLKGGVSASTHALTLERRGSRTEVVLKRFLAAAPQIPIEWQRTLFAEQLPVPSPKPIAFDAGDWFGAPAYVVSRLPGRADLRFVRATRNYEQIAETILALAATSPKGLPRTIRRDVPGKNFKPHPELVHNELVDEALTLIRRYRAKIAKLPTIVGHGDIHPGNMLWSRGRLSGIVDWSAVGLHYLTREVVYCRTELSVLFGLREADAFAETFERVSGKPLELLRAFDLMQGVTALQWVMWWAHAYRQQGRPDLTDAVGRRRARAFLQRAVSGN